MQCGNMNDELGEDPNRQTPFRIRKVQKNGNEQLCFLARWWLPSQRFWFFLVWRRRRSNSGTLSSSRFLLRFAGYVGDCGGGEYGMWRSHPCRSWKEKISICKWSFDVIIVIVLCTTKHGADLFSCKTSIFTDLPQHPGFLALWCLVDPSEQ